MGKIAENCNLDTDHSEEARALHRVVRAMHDGHCPQCGYLAPAEKFYRCEITNPHHKDGPRPAGHVCPACGFGITAEEALEALARFRPCLNESVKVFLKWRSARSQPAKEAFPTDAVYAARASEAQHQALEQWLTGLGVTKECASDYFLTTESQEDGATRYTLMSTLDKTPITAITLKTGITDGSV